MDNNRLGPRTRVRPPEFAGASLANLNLTSRQASPTAVPGGPRADVPKVWAAPTGAGQGAALTRVTDSNTRGAAAPSSGGTSTGQRRDLHIPGQVIDIMDLPDTRTRMARARTGAPVASRTSPVSSPPPGAVQAVAFEQAASYAHDPSYRWLRGKIEYSRTDRRWKLRYIPIDGNPDRYGGSVALAEGTTLADFAAGDFVEVRGQLRTGSQIDWGYAPVYRVEQIRPL